VGEFWGGERGLMDWGDGKFLPMGKKRSRLLWVSSALAMDSSACLRRKKLKVRRVFKENRIKMSKYEGN